MIKLQNNFKQAKQQIFAEFNIIKEDIGNQLNSSMFSQQSQQSLLEID